MEKTHTTNKIKIQPPERDTWKGKIVKTGLSFSPSLLFKTIIDKSRISRFSINPVVFLIGTIAVTFSLTYLCSQFIVWEEGNLLYPSIWLTGFTILVFDLVLHVLCAILYRLSKSHILKETALVSIPACAELISGRL